MELWIVSVSIVILAANILRMAYRLRNGKLADATVVDWVFLSFFTAALIVAVPYCFLRCMGQSHDFWRILPPFD